MFWGRSMRKVTDHVTRYAYQPTQLDELDDRVDSWSTDGELVGIFEFDPGGSVETVLPGHDRVITTPTLYLPYNCPLRQHDKVQVGIDVFRVVGHPARWKHRRTGREVGDVVKLERVEG